MPIVRALNDLKINGIHVPVNRIAYVSDSSCENLIEAGQATTDPKHIQTAVMINPEVIEIEQGYTSDLLNEAVFVGSDGDQQENQLTETETETDSDQQENQSEKAEKTAKK